MWKYPAALVALSLLASPALAKPTTVNATMAICTSVIADQYQSDEDPLPRWGECFGAVEDFLEVIGAASPSADPLIAELVAELAELYREDSVCRIRETELPIAIATAAAAVYDDVVKAEFILLREQVGGCDIGGTASIVDTPASGS